MEYTFAPYTPTPVLQGHLRLGGADPAGVRLDANSRYLTCGGRPLLPVMGEYHFSRDSRQNWPRELAKIRAGGVTVVATYLFWLYHEEEEGRRDFSGDLDIRAFVTACAAQGLQVLLRIGPWAHGECRNGGFPDWLQHSGLALRTNDPAYLAKVRSWYASIYAQVQGLLYKDGGPIIGVQLDNELTDGAEHLLALKQLAREVGFTVPLYTVTGWNNVYGARIPVDEVLPVFSAYADHPWDDTVAELPLSYLYSFVTTRNDSAVGVPGADAPDFCDSDGWRLPYERYPYAICEMGCGLQPTHKRRPIVSPMDAYAMSLVKLGCGNNLIGYYMYHGGTNRIGRLSTFQESTATGYPNDLPILNYDFGTCLGQYGEARPQYGLLTLLHLFAADFGDRIAPMEHVPAVPFVPCTDTEHLRCGLRTDGHSAFVFVNHHQRHARLKEARDVVLKVLDVTFPAIRVRRDICFFFPVHMDLCGQDLAWATAQPICRHRSTFFFAAIPGIPPQYAFAGPAGLETVDGRPGRNCSFVRGGVRVVTLPLDSARFLRRLRGEMFLGDGCDVYRLDGPGGPIHSIAGGDFVYWRWDENGGKFRRRSVRQQRQPACLTLTPAPEPFAPRYAEELDLGGPRRRRWYRMHVDTADCFVEIRGDYDAAQIYSADGSTLLADNFNTGRPWRVPAALLYGQDCWLVQSERRDDFYMEP